jgi:protocatechuate 3,4-dioxygenase beta subunit
VILLFCHDANAHKLDILGVSALVDILNHRHSAGATASTVLGPFHVNHDVMLPLWGNISEGQAGAKSFVSGKVLDTEGVPIEGVLMDFWQTDGEKGSSCSGRTPKCKR